ncbi:MAG: DUF3352 domain-containing protein [Planctomycetes bacterium]|nr:DUF3352 domain-containing protein [Planctomycetota bacterium]
MLNELLLLSALLAPGPGDPPPRAADPARLFPAGSYGMVEFAGLDACREAAAGYELLGLAERLLVRSQGTDFDRMLATEVVPELDRGLGELGLTRADVREGLRGPVALGVSRVTFFDEDPMPSLALALRGGDAGAKLVGTFLRMVGNEAPRAERYSFDVAGVTIDAVRSGSSNGAIATAVFDGWAVAASNPDYLADVVRTARGSGSSLADVPALARARGQSDALLGVFVNTGPLFDALLLAAPYEADPILTALGIQRVDGLWLGAGVRGVGSFDWMRAEVTHSESGFVAALLSHDLAARGARFCPPDTLLTLSQSIDIDAIAARFVDLVDAFPGEVRSEVRRELFQDAAEELRREGIDPQHLVDFLRKLGPEVSVAVTMPQIALGVPAGVPPILAFVQAQDTDAAGKLARFLIERGAPLETVDFDGRAVWYTSIQEEGLRLSPAMTQVDDLIVFSSDLRALKAAVRRAADPADPSLADEPDYAAMRAMSENAVMMEVVRLRRNLAALYDAYAPLLEGFLERNTELGLTMEDMPTPAELEGMLTDVVFAMHRDRGGITFSAQSPIGVGAALAVVGSLADRALANGGPPR